MAELNLEGRVLAEKYELTRLLGQGGMGQVWEARNHLGKRFAVKLLLQNDELNGDPALAQRFFREAKASAAIESEHIVEVYDTGIDPQTRCPFIIMEMLKGEDLEHTIERIGPMAPVGACRIVAQAAAGLGHAHAAGIVHRDIKPANIFMTTRGPGDYVVKLLDFGIAKQQMDKLASTDGAGLTKTGSMLGTPLYMSPEQARGLKSVDARTDIWSLGMCLYESLSGRVPWGDVETLGELILSICSRDVPNLQDVAPWVPPELARVVAQSLERDASRRIPTADAFVEALRPFCGGSLHLAPEVLVGVDEAQRQTAAPRVSQMSQMSQTAAAAPPVTVGQSQPGLVPVPSAEPAKKGTPVVAIALAAVVLLAGGGVIAMKLMGGGSAAASEKKVEAPAKPEKTEKTDDKSAKPETSKAEEPKQKPEEPKAPASVEPPASAVASVTAKQPLVAGPIPGKPAVPAGPTAKASASVVAPPATTAAPAASSGRIIRKDI